MTQCTRTVNVLTSDD